MYTDFTLGFHVSSSQNFSFQSLILLFVILNENFTSVYKYVGVLHYVFEVLDYISWRWYMIPVEKR